MTDAITAQPRPPAPGTPIPDPTPLTTAQLVRTMNAERDYADGQVDVLRERLRGVDRATDLRHAQETAVPSSLDRAIGHLDALMQERFTSIATQFRERDTRQERESRDNKVAVDAAFAAQKEAAAKQDEANSKAISKSEAATSETINKNAEVLQTTARGLSDKIDDLKERLAATEQRVSVLAAGSAGATAQRVDGRASVTVALAGLSLLLTLVIAVITILLSRQ